MRRHQELVLTASEPPLPSYPYSKAQQLGLSQTFELHKVIQSAQNSPVHRQTLAPPPPSPLLGFKGFLAPGGPPQTPPYNTSVPSSLLCWGDSSLSQIEIKARIQSIESPHHLQPSRTPVTRSLHHVLASFIPTSELQVAQLWIKVLLWLYISKKTQKE